jgi:hypothetical protein
MNSESFYIEWQDPSDNIIKYACLSSETGLYWSEDTSDNGIIDGSFLDTEYTVEDTIRQIAEQVKLKKGLQYNRKFCIKHPDDHKWLKVEKKSTGVRDEETNKLIYEYRATWSHKFRAVAVVSAITGRPQGNPGLQNKEYARAASEKSKLSRKKRIENVEKAARRLNFNPAEALIAWAMGDDTKLNTKQPITNSQRLKSLEILAGYSWAKPKPVDPNIVDKNKQQGPVVHVTLPSNSRELDKHVLTHDSAESLEEYFKDSYKEPDEFEAIEKEAGEYDEKTGAFSIPNNGR